VLLLLAENICLQPRYRLFQTGFLRNAPCHSIDLKPLNVQGVAQFLSHQGEDRAWSRAAEYHQLTAGNPLLLQALFEDVRLSGVSAPDELSVGDAFAEAVQSCLYRGEALTLEAARSLALLGEHANMTRVARLLQCDVDLALRAVQLLEPVGIVVDGWFRHARTHEAVLATMTLDERAVLHGRIAHLLHAEGEPAAVVAHHLLCAGRVAAAWAQPTLREAAEHFLSVGEVDRARDCLRLARDNADDPQQRAETTSMLAQVEWRLDPANALWYLPELVVAVRNGQLSVRQALIPINYMLWHGQAAEAADALGALCSTETLDAKNVGGLSVSLLWLAYLYPDYFDRAQRSWNLLARQDEAVARSPIPRQAAAVLGTMLAHCPNGDATVAAEQALRRVPLEQEAFGPIAVALSALFLTDRFCSATVSWCDPLRDAPSLPPLTCDALSAAARAEFALSRGDLVAAEQHTRTGLAGISAKGWGVAIGSLVSTAVLAASEAGRHEDAAQLLSVPVPAAVFKTPFGLKYLYARGVYFLATDRVRLAVTDFEACGEMMTAWGLDMAGVVPWRTELARAYLMLGRRGESLDLAREQLARLSDGDGELRGVTLRVLAAASDPRKRLPLLKEATKLLRESGNQREVARVAADLNQALELSGAQGRGSVVPYGVRKLTLQCQAPTTPHADAPLQADVVAVASDDIMAKITQLTGAERRVAGLAAIGCSNREIAANLYITVSTVEQHLTRIYRKLRVNGRSELPAELNRNVVHMS
jgi:DNA-binding CsgD family transcriptional regulator/tetratricopeptide (TPR) repeat protein